MRTKGHLINNETGIGMEVTVVDLKPSMRFPHGAYALKIARTGRTIFAYSGLAPRSGVLEGMRQAAWDRGFLLCYEDDEAYAELMSHAEPIEEVCDD